ncbi:MULTISPECIES: hypothetical protein [Phyllobacteriaceae]|uniref:hypothetical protein n=1 Tax=Phyllobacteriaceae TaxID=69277 RepID=UPI002AC9F49E|nr:hypothetical protein [Chelativorans sp. M5D2P16]MDZ5698013.1 hypothetical protein [Chelativorans sp. M5D2P16]
MEALLPIIVQAVAGIIGGEAVGAAFKKAAMGQVARIISGAVGGIGGGALLAGVGGDAGMLSGLLGDAVGGLVGGGVLSGVVGAVMGTTKKS